MKWTNILPFSPSMRYMSLTALGRSFHIHWLTIHGLMYGMSFHIHWLTIQKAHPALYLWVVCFSCIFSVNDLYSDFWLPNGICILEFWILYPRLMNFCSLWSVHHWLTVRVCHLVKMHLFAYVGITQSLPSFNHYSIRSKIDSI